MPRVTTAVPSSTSHRRSTSAPTCRAPYRSTWHAGYAMTMPATPTQNDWASTITEMRHRGMPSASRMANSRALAVVAEYSVWAVMTEPTSRPSRAA